MEECMIVELFEWIWTRYAREQVVNSNRRTCYAVTFEALDYAWLLRMQWHRQEAVLSGSVVIVDRSQAILVDRLVAASAATRPIGRTPTCGQTSELTSVTEMFMPLAQAAAMLPRKSHVRLDGELSRACQTLLHQTMASIQAADAADGGFMRAGVRSKIADLSRKQVPRAWTLMQGLQGLRKREVARFK